MIGDAFHSGGWGMFPTALFGLLMMAVSVRYAVRPDKRHVPLIVSAGVLTMVGGLLGFVTGLIKSLEALGGVGPERRFIWLIGMGESLNNVGLALALVLAATLATTIGAWRISRAAA